MRRAFHTLVFSATTLGLAFPGCGGDDGTGPGGGQPSQTWVCSEGGSASELGLGVTTDGAGNVIVTGLFSGRPYFGGTLLSSGGAADMFLAKYSPTGTILWVKSAGGADTTAGWGVATDGAGNVYVTGYFKGTATFGSTTLPNAGQSDIFVAKYDADGNSLWAKSAGGSGIDRARGIATDGSGNVIVGGRFQGSATFGGNVLNSAGADDIVLATFDGTGAVIRAVSAGGLRNDRCWAVAVAGDGSDDVVMTGFFADSAMFGTTMVRGAGGGDIVVAKYNSSGVQQWVRPGGGTGYDLGWDIATDGSDIYVTGSFFGTATIGTTTLPSAGGEDIFVARYNALGNSLWARSAGGINNDRGVGVGVDGSHNVVITGFFESSASFSGTNLTAAGPRDGYIAKYGVLGALQWVQPIAGTGSNNGWDVTAQPSGYIVGTGSYQDQATIGSASITVEGLDDVFVVKAGANGFD
jgi:hypothetical protein